MLKLKLKLKRDRGWICTGVKGEEKEGRGEKGIGGEGVRAHKDDCINAAGCTMR